MMFVARVCEIFVSACVSMEQPLADYVVSKFSREVVIFILELQWVYVVQTARSASLDDKGTQTRQARQLWIP